MELRHKYDLELLLNCMKMIRSSYSYYEKRSQLVDKYKDIKNLIKQIYNCHKGRLVYLRITLAIKQKRIVINHKNGIKINQNFRIEKFNTNQKIQVLQRRTRKNSSKYFTT